MNSCVRCGEKLSHNYLEAIFTMVKEKRERIIVCSKCKEILTTKKENKVASTVGKADNSSKLILPENPSQKI